MLKMPVFSGFLGRRASYAFLVYYIARNIIVDNVVGVF